jgi:hypothetical protein
MTTKQNQTIEAIKQKKIFDGYEIRETSVDAGDKFVCFSIRYGRHGSSCAYHNYYIIGLRGAVRKQSSRFI